MKLTEREKTIILAADKYKLFDTGTGYFPVGGPGESIPALHVRYNHRTLTQLGNKGLISRENGYWKATPTGVATASESGTVSADGTRDMALNWKRNSWDTLGL